MLPPAFSDALPQADSPATASPAAPIDLMKCLLDISFCFISSRVSDFVFPMSFLLMFEVMAFLMSELAVNFVSFHIYCAEWPCRAEILACSAAYAACFVDNRYLD